MQQRQAGRLGAWLQNHRGVALLLSVSLGSEIAAICLFAWRTEHFLDRTFSWMTPIASALIVLSGTFSLAAVPTAKLQPRGSDRLLPRLVVLGMLAPITAVGGMVWFGLHNNRDAELICMALAFVFNVIGFLGCMFAWAYQAPHSPVESPVSPSDHVVGS